MPILKDVKVASLEIDERFLEEFTAMKWGFDYQSGKASEAGHLLLHLFSRIEIAKYEKAGGQTGWVLTISGEESAEAYDASSELLAYRLARRNSIDDSDLAE